MERLIVTPLKETDISTVIVIDALDECTDDEPQSAILSVMGRFVEEIPEVKPLSLADRSLASNPGSALNSSDHQQKYSSFTWSGIPSSM